MSGVMRTSVRFLRPWRMISWPAAKGMRWVKPSMASVWPSFTVRSTASESGMIFVCIEVPANGSWIWNGVPEPILNVRLFDPNLRRAREENWMADEKKSGVDRRMFLKTTAASAVAAATTVAAADKAAEHAATPAQAGAQSPKNKEKMLPGDIVVERPGSDFMVDVIKTLDLEYITTNPASSFRSLHESLVNYGGNTKPELLTCTHEEAAVAIAHGYAKAAGKPMAAVMAGSVGVQHASMALYNAFVDRVPIIVFAGNGLDASTRRPGTEWYHSVQDPAVIVRDFLKWDDYPVSLQHFAESTVRAYKVAMMPPMEPVMIGVDIDLQEEEIHEQSLRIPKLARSRPSQGDRAALAEAAKWLVAAEHPVIIADRCARNQEGVRLLVELAEALQAPVVDLGGRLN